MQNHVRLKVTKPTLASEIGIVTLKLRMDHYYADSSNYSSNPEPLWTPYNTPM